MPQHDPTDKNFLTTTIDPDNPRQQIHISRQLIKCHGCGKEDEIVRHTYSGEIPEEFDISMPHLPNGLKADKTFKPDGWMQIITQPSMDYPFIIFKIMTHMSPSDAFLWYCNQIDRDHEWGKWTCCKFCAMKTFRKMYARLGKEGLLVEKKVPWWKRLVKNETHRL